MQINTCPRDPRAEDHRATVLAAVSAILLAAMPGFTQCADWPTGCPDISQHGVSDDANTPIALSPGHTAEELCPETVNENHELQIDLTDTFVTIDEFGQLYLRSFYNNNSAASTTEQFWFFDVDNNSLTGGGDGVPPSYLDSGPKAGQGPTGCDMPGCTLELLPTVHETGYEFYVHSFGPSVDDCAIFFWDGVEWMLTQTPSGVINLQSAEDDPLNPYGGNNGYRGLAYLPKEALGITNDYFTIFVRSWSCADCCGDNTGGEGIVLQPGMRPCETSRCGDCDANGFVNILDALRAAHHDAGLAELNDLEFSNCNVAGSLGPSFVADVSILDALAIAQYVVGLGTLECCVCCIP